MKNYQVRGVERDATPLLAIIIPPLQVVGGGVTLVLRSFKVSLYQFMCEPGQI